MGAEIEVLFRQVAEVVEPAVQLVGLAAQVKLEKAVKKIARKNTARKHVRPCNIATPPSASVPSTDLSNLTRKRTLIN